MRRRDLIVERSGAKVGALSIDDVGKVRWEGVAGDVLAGERRRRGEGVAAVWLLDNGWSNGYLFLAEEEPAKEE